MKLVINKNVVSVRKLSAAGLFAIAILSSSQVSAASACKGLDNKSCAEQSSCGWVQSYERKDGRTVNAFCRTKARGGSNKASDKSLGQKTSLSGKGKSG